MVCLSLNLRPYARVIEELVFEIRKNIGCIYKVSESIARLDLLIAFSSYVTITPSCVRPEFSTDGPLGMSELCSLFAFSPFRSN